MPCRRFPYEDDPDLLHQANIAVIELASHSSSEFLIKSQAAGATPSAEQVGPWHALSSWPVVHPAWSRQAACARFPPALCVLMTNWRDLFGVCRPAGGASLRKLGSWWRGRWT